MRRRLRGLFRVCIILAIREIRWISEAKAGKWKGREEKMNDLVEVIIEKTNS